MCGYPELARPRGGGKGIPWLFVLDQKGLFIPKVDINIT
jgi:hypothetical protein